MILSKNSLGGQNSYGRMSGARSSRASSTIFKKLRKLDREISRLDRAIWFAINPRKDRLTKQRNKLDQKRKNIRLQRKGITP